MDNPSDFNEKDFLKSGAVFAKEDRVWLFWGVPKEVAVRPEGPCLSISHFLEMPAKHWLRYPHVLCLKREEAKSLFSLGKYLWSWQEAKRESFEAQFQVIQEAFASQEIEKAVPYVFEVLENAKMEPDRLSHMLCSAFEVNTGFLYGYWLAGEGFLGVTPETLVSQSSEKNFATMALAGTTTKESFSKNPQNFLSDPKEGDEHQKVVDDICEQLASYGEVKTDRRQTQETPHLVHLLTPIQLRTTENGKLNSIVQALHPTPALGCYPRRAVKKIMEEFNKIEPRDFFGAPFGISYSLTEAEFVVAIRNVMWTNQSVKLGSGCGVVPASHFESEWNELHHKRLSVKKMLGVL